MFVSVHLCQATSGVVWTMMGGRHGTPLSFFLFFFFSFFPKITKHFVSFFHLSFDQGRGCISIKYLFPLKKKEKKKKKSAVCLVDKGVWADFVYDLNS